MFGVCINEGKHDVNEFVDPNSLIKRETKKLKPKLTSPTTWLQGK